MLTKIKNSLKKVTKFEWVILAIAVVALWVGLTHTHGHKGKHKAEKAPQAVVETK
jgi:hypothetical protein